jgi:simple sugar transport system ATP-binding protein
VPPGSNRAAIAAGIAYLSEDRLGLGLVMRQPIASNIVLASLDRLGGRWGIVPPGRRRTFAGGWAERLRLRHQGLDRPVQELSGGNQQRVVLAKWLATEPRVLILDSPTVGVDIGNKRAIYELVRELADRGIAILLISDEIPEVLYNADRVLLMRAGRVVGEHVPGAIGEADLEALVYA